jgi:hypothetical protein
MFELQGTLISKRFVRKSYTPEIQIQTISSRRYPELLRLLRSKSCAKKNRRQGYGFSLRSRQFTMPSDKDEELILIISETSPLRLVPGSSLPSEDYQNVHFK